MIFKSIYINLNRTDYPNDFGYDLLLKSRHLLAFLERETLKKIKYKTIGFNRWVIKLEKTPRKDSYINSNKVLVSEIFFDQDEYEKSKNDTTNYFINVLKKSLLVITKSDFDIPINELMNGINKYKAIGCKNEWIHKKKKHQIENILQY